MEFAPELLILLKEVEEMLVSLDRIDRYTTLLGA
jgi:hypothetical protein